MLNITLKQIETFVWLAALKSFRRVGEQMHTTQPNVSSRISSLEKALDLRLFERDAGSVALTDQGRTLLPIAEQMLQGAEALLRASDRTREQSVLRLGVAETVAQTWMHGFLKEINRRHPHIVVELTVDITATLQRSLVERNLDLAFLNGPISELSVTNLPLGTVALVWVASPEIARQLPKRVTAKHLSRFPILTHARNTRPYAEVVDFFKRARTRLDLPVSSSNQAVCLDMAVAGLGIATLPQQIVQPLVKSGKLVVLDCDWKPTPMTFTASYVSMPSRSWVEDAAGLATEVANWGPKKA